MRKIYYLFPIAILVIFFGWYFLQKSTFKQLISPVLGSTKVRPSTNLWFPQEATVSGGPEVTAKAAIFVDPKTGQVLYQKNPYQKLSIASLIKIMTTIVTLEQKNLDDVFDVSQRAADMEPDKMLLIRGERLTLKELLDGIFLVSANDAAEVLAEEVTNNREEFINLMNQKALTLGMKDSFFINPTGLEEDNQKQYSTAYDVLLMSRYAISTWPQLLEISSQPHILIPQTSTHQDYDLYSGINLLTTYPGVLGFKTGYTPEAGLTLVTFAKKENKEVLGVILGSTARREDAKILLDYSFTKLGVRTPD